MMREIFKIVPQKKIKEKSKLWTCDEDNILFEISNSSSNRKWKMASEKLKNKTAYHCYVRYKTINPSFTKGKWSKIEDEVVNKLVRDFGENWKLISKILKTRSNKQIRLRYENYLKEGINLQAFSEDEDNLLIELHSQLANKWSLYKKNFPNRSALKIKRRVEKLLREKGFEAKKTRISSGKRTYSENLDCSSNSSTNDFNENPENSIFSTNQYTKSHSLKCIHSFKTNEQISNQNTTINNQSLPYCNSQEENNIKENVNYFNKINEYKTNYWNNNIQIDQSQRDKRFSSHNIESNLSNNKIKELFKNSFCFSQLEKKKNECELYFNNNFNSNGNFINN